MSTTQAIGLVATLLGLSTSLLYLLLFFRSQREKAEAQETQKRENAQLMKTLQDLTSRLEKLES